MKVNVVISLNLSFNGEAGKPHENDTLVIIRLETSVPALPAVGTTIDAPFFGDDGWKNNERWLYTAGDLKIEDVKLSYAKRGVLEYTLFLEDFLASREGEIDTVFEKLENISIPGSIFFATTAGFPDWKPFSVDSEFFRHLQEKLVTWSQLRKI